MRHSYKWSLLALLAVALLCNCLLVMIKSSHVALALPLPTATVVATPSSIVTTTASPRPTVVATPTPPAGTSGADGGWDDSTIIAAIIGFGGVLLTVIIALYQMRRSERLQKEQATQNEKLQRELANRSEQFQLQIVQREKDSERQKQQQEQQNEIRAAEMKRQKMLHAADNEQRGEIYREDLQQSPRVATIKILDMRHHLELLNVYVRLRLHEETQLIYRQELLHEQETPQRDPNAAFQSDWKRREQRTAAALVPEEAVAKYRRCVLLGDPGAGKTTLLRYLTLMTAKRAMPELADLLPIYIELNAFASSGLSDLLDYAAQSWDDFYAFPPKDARLYMADQLYVGKAVLLLDGLDETMVGGTVEQAKRSYTAVSQAIEQIETRYPRAFIVVTARKAGYQQRAPLAGFTELEVLDFQPEDIQQFITNWYASSHDPQRDEKTTDLTQRLNRNPRLQTLATNPLLLSLIVMVYEAQHDLPDRRADLYKRCIDIFLSAWDDRRHISRLKNFAAGDKQQLLEVISWHFHQQRQRYFPERELLKVIADFLPKIGLARDQDRAILLEITSEHGLLKEQAPGWYGFVHLTLQEYFVASAAADQEYFASLAVTNQIDLQRLLVHRADAWWEEVFLLYAGSVSDASLLLRQLLGLDQDDPLREDIFSTNLLLAGRCLSSQPTVRDVELRLVIIERLFETLQTTPYKLLQHQAVEVLATMGNEEVNKRLMELLKDPALPEILQMNISYALGESGERALVPDLLLLLKDPTMPGLIRMNIARALGKLGERSIAADLLLLFKDTTLPADLRLDIAQGLRDLRGNTIIPDLLLMLRNPPVPPKDPSVLLRPLDIRPSIAYILGESGERALVPDLLLLLQDSTLPELTRMSIAETLGELGEHAIAPDLLLLLKDPSLSVSLRASIAGALGTLGGSAIIPDLLVLLKNPSLSVSLRAGAAIALGKLGERTIIPDLLLLLKDSTLFLDLRENIAEILGSLGEHTAAANLLVLLKNPSLSVSLRARIAEALGALGERAIVPDLLLLLKDPDLLESLRPSIAKTLGAIGESAIVSDLLLLIEDPTLPTYIRISIAEALEILVNDLASTHQITRLLTNPGLADAVYKLLWTVSQRMGASIFPLPEPTHGKVEITKWKNMN